jgi:hypothetical protein
MCCSFVITFVQVFFNSPTNLPIKQGLKWCAALWWLHVLGIFQSYPHLWSRDWVMCCSFVIPCVRVFFNSPTQFPPMKQGLSDVLLFVITWYIFNSPTIPTYKAGIEWCVLFWFLSLCLVLEYFSTVLPTYKAGWVMCCSFVIPFLCWS